MLVFVLCAPLTYDYAAFIIPNIVLLLPGCRPLDHTSQICSELVLCPLQGVYTSWRNSQPIRA